MSETEEKVDETKLPAEVEASIAYRWSDNAVAAQMTRTVARAMLRQNFTADQVQAHIHSAGRVVE